MLSNSGNYNIQGCGGKYGILDDIGEDGNILGCCAD